MKSRNAISIKEKMGAYFGKAKQMNTHSKFQLTIRNRVQFLTLITVIREQV